jgi:hypothetical protein
MYRFACIAGGTLVVFAVSGLALPITSSDRSSSSPVKVDRASKGERLASPRPDAHGDRRIAAVEIVGLRNAAIVYRDGSGNVLFRSDPVANVTIVSKGVILPEVTIREHRDPPPRRVPVDIPTQPGAAPATGCDPVVSPVAAPGLAGMIGRCLAGDLPVLALAGPS